MMLSLPLPFPTAVAALALTNGARAATGTRVAISTGSDSPASSSAGGCTPAAAVVSICGTTARESEAGDTAIGASNSGGNGNAYVSAAVLARCSIHCTGRRLRNNTSNKMTTTGMSTAIHGKVVRAGVITGLSAGLRAGGGAEEFESLMSATNTPAA